MKKYSIWALTLITVFTMGLFTSCDDDLNGAMTLSGEWSGDMGMFYEWKKRGRIYRFDADYSYIVFYPQYEYDKYGTGKQVDYYRYGPYERHYYYFRWEIRNGIIYLTYPGDRELDTSISDYSLSYRRFRGRFNGSNSYFELYKMTDYYNWNDYNGNYYYYERYDWGSYYPNYAPETRSNKVISNDSVQGRIVRRGNRFKEETTK